MPLYNLIEYSDNYFKTSGSLWIYYRDGTIKNGTGFITDFPGDNNSDLFKYKQKPIGKTDDDNTLDFKMIVPLKHLSNFWRTPEMKLINCSIYLILTWFANFIMALQYCKSSSNM